MRLSKVTSIVWISLQYKGILKFLIQSSDFWLSSRFIGKQTYPWGLAHDVPVTTEELRVLQAPSLSSS